MTVALHGNLRDFGMGEVFQLIGQQRKTGVLEVRGIHGEVELRFDTGCVVSAVPLSERGDAPLLDMIARCGLVPRDRLAELETASDEPLAKRIEAAGLLGADALREVEDLLTRETIFELLRWDDGSFRFVAQPIEHERSAEHLLGAEQVLMDGLRMVDEWHAFAAEKPDEQTVFRRRGSVEEYRSSPAGRAAPALVERVYLLVDGRATVRRVIDLSRVGSFEATRALVQLARGGWIEPVSARRESEAGAGRSAPRSAGRARAAVVAPFALLALLAAIAWLRPAPEPDPLALPVSPLAAARAELEAQRWRALLHAHRLATGTWASDLDAVAKWAGGAAPALTRSERDAYHVAQRDEGAVLLAPDR